MLDIASILKIFTKRKYQVCDHLSSHGHRMTPYDDTCINIRILIKAYNMNNLCIICLMNYDLRKFFKIYLLSFDQSFFV